MIKYEQTSKGVWVATIGILGHLDEDNPKSQFFNGIGKTKEEAFEALINQLRPNK